MIRKSYCDKNFAKSQSTVFKDKKLLYLITPHNPFHNIECATKLYVDIVIKIHKVFKKFSSNYVSSLLFRI